VFLLNFLTSLVNIAQRYATLRWLEVRKHSVFGLTKT
jgi:hypothetical protein